MVVLSVQATEAGIASTRMIFLIAKFESFVYFHITVSVHLSTVRFWSLPWTFRSINFKDFILVGEADYTIVVWIA